MKDKRPGPYPLRMSVETRTKLEKHANTLSRSLNAEIISRIEGSLLTERASTGILTAKEAEKLASLSHKNIANSLRELAAKEISKSINIGKFSAYIDLEPYEIYDQNEPFVEVIIKPLIKELTGLGYSVDDDGTIDGFFVRFGEGDIKKT